jgi:hypothetical protein
MKKQLIIGILLLLLGVATIAIKIIFFPQLTTASSSWDLDFFIIACGIIQIAIGIGLVGIYLQETKKLGNGE